MIGPKIAALVTVMTLVAGTAAAQAPSPSPYDMTYRLRTSSSTPLYAAMSEKSATKTTLPADAKGIVLRWCRSEIPFGSWQFGSRRAQLQLLDARWCEVSYKGTVGNLPGSVLTPE